MALRGTLPPGSTWRGSNLTLSHPAGLSACALSEGLSGPFTLFGAA